MRGFFFHSKSLNPYENLAIEEAALNSRSPTLYLWQNDKTVVIGRNQSAFVECNLDYAKEQNIKIARRITGGGAVYHDLGNLNFSFILPKKSYDIKRSTCIILNTLHKLKIAVNTDGRNDICFADKKISGNAYYSNSVVGLHHGTILYDADFDTLEKVLLVSTDKKSRHSVSSVRARVNNIKAISPNISLEEIIKTIKEEFCVEYGISQLLPLHSVDTDALIKKHSSYDWIYRRVANYEIIKAQAFNWGEVSVSLHCDCENIKNIDIVTDAMYADLIDDLRFVFNEELAKSPNLTAFLQKIQNKSTQIAYDISTLLENCIRKHFNV